MVFLLLGGLANDLSGKGISNPQFQYGHKFDRWKNNMNLKVVGHEILRIY